jgi:hypothetical protein
MWDRKMDPEIYSYTLPKTKQIGGPYEMHYQTVFENLLNTVKKILQDTSEYSNTQAYMWYAEKLWSLTQRYSGPALQKEADALYLWHLARGRNDIALRTIAKSLGVNISPLESILENVMAPLLLSIVKQGSITTDGTEQTIVEYVGNISQISGYIDLSNMQDGDTVTIRTYVKIKPDGEYRLYDSEDYAGKQESPALYILPKLTGVAYKVTIQQTSGSYKSFDYLFVKGV